MAVHRRPDVGITTECPHADKTNTLDMQDRSENPRVIHRSSQENNS